jgi:uncharacterized repeat protein (TIGR03943 family)
MHVSFKTRIVAALALGSALALTIFGWRTGAVHQFVSPRIMVRTVIGLTVVTGFATWWAIRGARVRSNAQAGMAGVWPLLVPLVLLPAAASSTSDDYGRVRLLTPGGGLSRLEQPMRSKPAADDSWVDAPNPDLVAAVRRVTAGEADAEQVVMSPAGSDRIVINQDQFSDQVNRLWDAPADYAGREVSISGFVYRGDGWPADSFVVARLSIWCCAADAAVVGLLAGHDGPTATTPVSGEWIRLTGTVYERERFDAGFTEMGPLPELRDVRWTRIDAPDMEYVFP